MIVYLITNLVNGKKYVGQSVKTLSKRWGIHKAYAAKGSSFYFHRAIKKYGHENFCTQILFITQDASLCSLIEKTMIKYYETRDTRYGYNLTDGGEGTLGRVLSQETKDKISRAHIGKKFSLESRKKMSVAKSGRTVPSLRGKPLSAQTRAKISASMKRYRESLKSFRKATTEK